MDGRSLFGAIVRTIGLGYVLFQLYTLIQIVPALASGRVPMSQEVALAVIMPVLWMAIGLLIMRRADAVVSFAYPAAKAAGAAAKPAASKPAPRTKR
jgi:hypothetical protein